MTFFFPAENALLPTLVTSEDLTAANSLCCWRQMTLAQTNSAPEMRGQIFALIGTINGFITILASIAAGGM